MDLLPHSLTHAVEKSGTSRQDNVLEEVLSNVLIAFLNRVVAVLMDTFKVKSSLLGVEHYFSSSESLVTNEDLSAVREFIVLFASMAILSIFNSGVKVVDDIAHLLLDVSDDFELSVGCETVTTLVEDLLKVGGDVSTGQVDALNSMRNGITLVDRYSMGNSISGVCDNTRGSTV